VANGQDPQDPGKLHDRLIKKLTEGAFADTVESVTEGPFRKVEFLAESDYYAGRYVSPYETEESRGGRTGMISLHPDLADTSFYKSIPESERKEFSEDLIRDIYLHEAGHGAFVRGLVPEPVFTSAYKKWNEADRPTQGYMSARTSHEFAAQRVADSMTFLSATAGLPTEEARKRLDVLEEGSPGLTDFVDHFVNAAEIYSEHPLRENKPSVFSRILGVIKGK